MWSCLAASLRRLPSLADARALLAELLWLIPVLALAMMASPVMGWDPQFDLNVVKLAVVAIVMPSLGEELLFRVAPLPQPDATRAFPWKAAAVSLVAFVLWHPLQAFLFGGTRAAIFLDPGFLLAVAALGIACTRLYWKSGSVWPPVALHWLVVLGWKSLAGGPTLI